MPLTLHGSSGTDDDDFRRAIEVGITIVHISTELRLAWRRGGRMGLRALASDDPMSIGSHQSG